MLRRRNPFVSPGHIVGSLVLIGVGLFASNKAHAAIVNTKKKKAPLPEGPEDEDDGTAEGDDQEPTELECAPYVWDGSPVRAEIYGFLDDGQRDPALIAVNTATKFFGQHPEGLPVSFPPMPTSPSEAHCVYAKVLAEVERAFKDRGVEPGDDEFMPSSGVTWRLVSVKPGSPDLNYYPWDDAVLEENNYPTPGTFNLVDSGDYGAIYFQQLLGSALAMAGVDPSVAWDNNSKVGKRLRKEMRDLVICANDAIVTSSSCELAGGREPGTNGPNDPGVCYMMGPNGRGLTWVPRHKNNMQRLQMGLPQQRNVTLSGHKIGSGASNMLLWNPPLNLEKLRGAVPVVTTAGMTWASGKNTIHYPTPVDILGVDTNNVAFPGGEGCVPLTGPWE